MLISDYLLQKKKITNSDYEKANITLRNYGGDVGEILVRLGAINQKEYQNALSEFLQIDVLSSDEIPPINEIISNLNAISVKIEFALNHQFIVLKKGERYKVATLNPISNNFLNITSKFDFDYEVKLLSSSDWEYIKDSYKRLTVSDDINDKDISYLKEMAEQAPIIDFVNLIFATSLERKASDIHIEPFEDFYVIRMRIDGILHDYKKLPLTNYQAVVSRIKLLSAMDIAQKRIPQDGRQSIRVAAKEIDLRVSTLPSSWGESLVMRLLLKSDNIPALAELGMTEDQSLKFLDLISKPNGIILITGPTGSGKTTTIYRLIDYLNDGSKKIISIEDPVEYDIKGVMQMQVHEQIGLTFAKGLRSILRQDPDIIVIGEIRDNETAKIAVQAALTGHLVISTLHTNSALAAIPRLMDLGLDSFLLADVLIGLAAQRLGRRICKNCFSYQPKSVEKMLKEKYHIKSTKKILKNNGCEKCNNTGYEGRFALAEIYDVDKKIKSLIRKQASIEEMETYYNKLGYKNLFEDGIEKALLQITTIDEVKRISG